MREKSEELKLALVTNVEIYPDVKKYIVLCSNL